MPDAQSGDVGYMLVSTALVLFMVPGVGYFYSGMARDKNALSLILISIVSLAIVSLQWFAIGFSLVFSPTATNGFIGDGRYAFLQGLVGRHLATSSTLPAVVTCVYQLMFAAITPALVIGAIAERFNMIPMCAFILVWTTIVYDPIAYWAWGVNGWLSKFGALDFAGGLAVHLSSGVSGLALAQFCGKRRSSDEPHMPHSISNVMLGTAMLWFGWNGFNGGSEGSANARAAMTVLVTNLAASTGGLTWMLINYIRDRRVSAVGFCSGVVAGLVAITPACGYVGPAASLAISFAGAFVCNHSARIKHKLGYDDTLDVFGIHGVGGAIGCLLTGIFADREIISMDDGAEEKGGAVSGNPVLIVYQLVAIATVICWSFLVTYLIAFLMAKAGLSLRASEEDEELGVDHSQMGEYTMDVVGIRISASVERRSRLLLQSTSAQNVSITTSPPLPPPLYPPKSMMLSVA
ncbi:ammonium transporter AmtB-like domain-containing protein [Blastocladiella britannica]|nr:ammonium transporter AmtB-like domain-containing protein [Blastocladiella britannica]